ncbi:hypothetical protein PSEUBRA_003090 [Kalmanozyma brasiliensis GHG001]|uniref:uncharacterized protein n=1 Tax=Kalmanozyma brasiliensis (strain GHG001) TaxID=1365824 RepID=UPI0028680A92|nr:uncharacterized protein PSEUBRA_003090 [Kalmanozyma brasiliensis GHG001]KAF6767185.1 hypothetical protein PSEUBRA_003090 [Kalmanozyma brasiliensis GHG001]
MSADDAQVATDARPGVAKIVGSSTDGEVLAPYLSLEEPRLVLDLRSDSAFHQAHLVGSYHISPIPALRSRYSYLPPRNVPFLVLADSAQRNEVAEAFASTPSARLVFLTVAGADIAESSATGGVDSIATSARFFDVAFRFGLARSSQSHQQRIMRSDAKDVEEDIPELLFRPSHAVRRTVLSLDERPHQYASLRVLDLGCGAARDLAWILHGSRTRPSSCTWTGVGVDNWKAALNRAQQLMDDLYLTSSSLHEAKETLFAPRCENLLWATCTDDGHLQPLTGSGKGKAIQNAEDHPEIWDDFRQLGLAPLLPASSGAAKQDIEAGEDAQFDLVLCIRFHPRALLPRLSALVRTGGVVLLSHFVTLSESERSAARQEHPEATADYDSPPHEGRIQPGEVERLVQTWNQDVGTSSKWIIESDVLEPIEDGRIIRSAALRKVALSI